MKYAVGITLFNPTINHLCNIEGYVTKFEKVFIYDNSSEKCKYDFHADNIEYYFNGENEGLCIAFNFILNKCYEHHIDILCTMDQDSILDNETIDSIKEFVEVKTNDIAIVSPKICYSHKVDKLKYKNKYEFKDWVICSGSFIDTNIIFNEKIIYDEYYFLDRFDQDFCKQLVNKGYKIVELQNCILKQELGYTLKKYSNHEENRHLYISRNRLYYNNKYYSGIKKIALNLIQFIRHVYEIIFYEDKKIKKIKKIIEGIYQYIFIEKN